MKARTLILLASFPLLLTGCPEKKAATEGVPTPPPAPAAAEPIAPAKDPAAAPVAAALEPAETPEEALGRAREATKSLGVQLKKALVKAMGEGGPEAAVSICNTQAPKIAAGLAEEKLLQIRRVSQKRRNPGNAPDAWETKVLTVFEKPTTPGGKVESQEHWEVVEAEGKKQLRYARSILTGGVCLKCHGSELEPGLQAKIASLYPADAATGFAEGDLRGIFSVTVDLP